MKNSKKSSQKWIKDLDGIDTDILNNPPFSFIKDQDFAIDTNLSVKRYQANDEIIRERQKVTDLFIVANGVVGIGDKRKGGNNIYWLERTTAERGSILGELEVDMKISINGKEKSFEAESASQIAWPSSKRLKWFAAYTDSEKKFYGSEVKLLKINHDVINDFVAVAQLKEYLLFDQFRKARGYFLDIEGNIQKSKTASTQQPQVGSDLAIRSRLLWEQRMAVKCAIQDTVYIFGMERYGVLLGTTLLKNYKNNYFDNIKKEASSNKSVSLDIQVKSADDFILGISSEHEPRFKTKARNQKNLSDTCAIYIEKGCKMVCLKPLNSKS